MTGTSGDGREEHLAPVTDLFSRKRRATAAEAARSEHPAGERMPAGASAGSPTPLGAHASPDTEAGIDASSSPDAPIDIAEQRGAYDADGWWVPEPDGDADADAPVPLPRAARAPRGQQDPVPLRPITEFPRLITAADLEPAIKAMPKLRPVAFREADADEPTDPTEPETPTDEEFLQSGEQALLRKLRSRGISISEARTFLRGLETPEHIIDQLIDLFVDRRYLDDAVLAEQLVYTATSRKAQGKRAIAQALSSRGIEREVIEQALEGLADEDEAERALEFARTKARSMARLEREVALRRLIGQLARRGFGGGIAMTAARTALDEVTGVRFR